MQSFEIAFASLLLLVPIVYFLPIGLTRTGKMLSLLMAFCVAMLGIMANSVLPLWELALLLASLVLLLSYMINKKLNGLFFLSMVTESTDHNKEEIQESFLFHSDDLPELEKENVELIKESSFSHATNEKSSPTEESLPMNGEELDEITPISFLQYIEDELSTRNADLEKNTETEPFVLSDLEKLLQEDLLSSETESETELETETKLELESESEIELESGLELETDFEIEAEDSVQKSSPPLLNESEDLLEEVNFEAYEENNHPVIDEIKDDEKHGAISKNWLEELDELEGLDDFVDHSTDQFYSLTTIDNRKAVYITDMELEDEINMNTESHTSPESGEEKIDSFPENTEEENLETISVKGEGAPDEETDRESSQHFLPQKTVLTQQKLFYTVAEQMKISGKKMDLLQFENQIKKILLTNLPVHDYYTFASLLIQRYIVEKEFKNLAEFLEEVKGKVSEYPILEMEMSYLSERYCEKSL